MCVRVEVDVSSVQDQKKKKKLNYINQCTHWFHCTREWAYIHYAAYSSHKSPLPLVGLINVVHGVPRVTAHWIMGKGERWVSVKTAEEQCRCWFLKLSICMSESSFSPFSIPSPPTLTKQRSRSPFPFRTKWKMHHYYSAAETTGKYGTATHAIDKSIMQSERTNCGFHHLAHQQLPMNYLLASFLFYFIFYFSSWCGKNPSRISKQGLSLPVSLNQNRGQAAPRPVCRLNYLPLIDVLVDQQFGLWIIHTPLSS